MRLPFGHSQSGCFFIRGSAGKLIPHRAGTAGADLRSHQG
jgi:hypothetical protein